MAEIEAAKMDTGFPIPPRPDICTAPCREKVQGIIGNALVFHKRKAAALQVLFDRVETLTADQEQLLADLPWYRLIEDRR